MSADPEAVERLDKTYERQTEKLARALEDKQNTDEQHDIKARPNLRQVPPASDSQAVSDSKVRKASVGDYLWWIIFFDKLFKEGKISESRGKGWAELIPAHPAPWEFPLVLKKGWKWIHRRERRGRRWKMTERRCWNHCFTREEDGYRTGLCGRRCV